MHLVSKLTWYQICPQINQSPLEQVHSFGIKSTNLPEKSTVIWYQINQPPFNNHSHLLSNQPASLEQVHSLVSNQPTSLEQVHSFGIKIHQPQLNKYIHWYQINQPPLNKNMHWYQLWNRINLPPLSNYIHLESNQPAPLHQSQSFAIKSTKYIHWYQINQPPLNKYIHWYQINQPPMNKYIHWYQVNQPPLDALNTT